MEYYELFFKLFDQQSYEKAIYYINLLKQEINNFPEPVLSPSISLAIRIPNFRRTSVVMSGSPPAAPPSFLSRPPALSPVPSGSAAPGAGWSLPD